MGAVVGIGAVGAVHEAQTSAIQAWIFSNYAERLIYSIGAGPSDGIVFPTSGPLDQRRGYTRLPELIERLQVEGYRVSEQARFSPALARLARWGIAPPYRLPQAGLALWGDKGCPLPVRAATKSRIRSYREIPEPVVEALLLIENRGLEEPPDPRSNPVIDWSRLVKASLTYAGHNLGLPVTIEGGSTLATQIEKYMHSRGGRTPSAREKLKQLLGASLKVYREGPDTRRARREIVVDYLNTMPLAALSGHGEIHGLGQGLRAWFGLEIHDVFRAIESGSGTLRPEEAFKRVLQLLCATRAPSRYLLTTDRSALEARVRYYTGLLLRSGIIEEDFARRLETIPDVPPPSRLLSAAERPPLRKTSDAIRMEVMNLLDVGDLYTLDRLHLDARTTIDVALQQEVEELLEDLKSPIFLEAHGLRQAGLLARGDPQRVVYSFLLLERAELGNAVLVETDTRRGAFQVNQSAKMELGSTAKLRALAHYLELVESLHGELASLEAERLSDRLRAARDPLTRWAARVFSHEPGLELDAFLERALDRRYSASPHEAFFTGGGTHRFRNFSHGDDGRVMPVREALERSVNLVFVRLMRDMVRFHEARLPYDAVAVLADTRHPARRRLLVEAAEDEARQHLRRAYRAYRGVSSGQIADRLLGRNRRSPRHLAIVFYAWHPGAPREALGRWLRARLGKVSPADVRRLAAAYGNPRLTLSDFGYLMRKHPLELWCAGLLERHPDLTWSEMWAKSGAARDVSSAWLFKTANRRAQKLRLRIRIERDAFERMTPSWRRLGFPFDRLVPSYATAIGSSSDRPRALAALMGIIVNDGVRLPVVRIKSLNFARGTAYHTILELPESSGERVLSSTVARSLRRVLGGVVERGTARRLRGAYDVSSKLSPAIGGKTGSGDNRHEVVGRKGNVLSTYALNRTATFVFYLGERHFGVITAFVEGPVSKEYRFTSALPVAILKLLAPSLRRHLSFGQPPRAAPEQG